MRVPHLRQPEAIDDMLPFELSRVVGTGSMVRPRCEGRFGSTPRKGAVIAMPASSPGLLSAELAQWQPAEVRMLETGIAALQQQAERLAASAQLPRADRRRGGRGRDA